MLFRSVDACYTQVDAKVTDMAVCDKMFPTAGDARLVAGAPRTDDILKCQLKPVSAADYKMALSADQMAKLKAAFPEGVCDYAKPGVGQVPLEGTWLKYPRNSQSKAVAAVK